MARHKGPRGPSLAPRPVPNRAFRRRRRLQVMLGLVGGACSALVVVQVLPVGALFLSGCLFLANHHLTPTGPQSRWVEPDDAHPGLTRHHPDPCQAVGMDEAELRAAFDDVHDHALVFHGYAEHLRDYDLYVLVTADPRTGIAPEHLRYRFTHCVRASVETAVGRDVWAGSLDDVLIDHDTWLRAGEPPGYVWGVGWSCLYPGLSLLPESDETREWSAVLGRPVRSALVETNGHDITLVFTDLVVDRVHPGESAFTIPPTA